MEAEGLGSERSRRPESGNRLSADWALERTRLFASLSRGPYRIGRVNYGRFAQAFPEAVGAAEAKGYYWPDEVDHAEEEGQDQAVPTVRAEARPADVPAGLGEVMSAPTGAERLIGAAKLYVENIDTLVNSEDPKAIYQALESRNEAKQHLQEAILDYDVAKWIAALDD